MSMTFPRIDAEKVLHVKHFNRKKKLVLSGVSALFTCCGAPPTSFFLGLTKFILKTTQKFDFTWVEIAWVELKSNELESLISANYRPTHK